jgi:fructose-bisphosphate aldolase, class I
MTTTLIESNSIESLLGKEAEDLLTYKAKVSKDLLHLPGPDFVDRIWINSDRNPQVLRNLQLLYSTGRLANTGYLSILPVDQGIEHSAAASFAPNPIYFDPENIVKLAIAAECNAVATENMPIKFPLFSKSITTNC